MLIGITSQNFRTITGHAGKTRRFFVYRTTADSRAEEVEHLDLPKTQSLHEFRGENHPLFKLDALITASCGNGFRRRLGAQGVNVIATSETDPAVAAAAVASGQALPAPLPHEQ